ncbi:orotate phosphoribosyltransferase [Paenibacillus nasutitermitis]|uniref:Orotate phosphoribosyltransferase n=1 Tax=Paenibacillus nasutitermitis TaxID=1652958 RepID=A0A917DXK7_9BACL|nr:orotate phosphoribosyltransferase [Paenibacillus nasutitermitis]GGD76297.1 orotate phosphoribosyltransferase [Paenibacillus nasutitermitis]
MEKEWLAKEIYAVSHLTGEFVLRSGQISNEYFDKYMFESDPRLLGMIATEMSTYIPIGTQVLAGIEMGAIPLTTALSLETSIPSAFVRKKAKDHGTCKIAEGIDVAGKKVCVIEDVITSGGQVVMSVNLLREAGAIVEDVICVILRSPQGRKRLEEINLRLHTLYTMEELNELGARP